MFYGMCSFLFIGLEMLDFMYYYRRDFVDNVTTGSIKYESKQIKTASNVNLTRFLSV